MGALEPVLSQVTQTLNVVTADVQALKNSNTGQNQAMACHRQIQEVHNGATVLMNEGRGGGRGIEREGRREGGRERERERERETDRQTDRQIDRQTERERQTDRQTDRQTSAFF